MTHNDPNTTMTSYAVLLETGLQALYGACSRARPEDIEREVLRINAAVQDLSREHLDPLQPLLSFHAVLRDLQDANNQELAQ